MERFVQGWGSALHEGLGTVPSHPGDSTVGCDSHDGWTSTISEPHFNIPTQADDYAFQVEGKSIGQLPQVIVRHMNKIVEQDASHIGGVY